MQFEVDGEGGPLLRAQGTLQFQILSRAFIEKSIFEKKSYLQLVAKQNYSRYSYRHIFLDLGIQDATATIYEEPLKSNSSSFGLYFTSSSLPKYLLLSSQRFLQG